MAMATAGFGGIFCSGPTMPPGLQTPSCVCDVILTSPDEFSMNNQCLPNVHLKTEDMAMNFN